MAFKVVMCNVDSRLEPGRSTGSGLGLGPGEFMYATKYNDKLTLGEGQLVGAENQRQRTAASDRYFWGGSPGGRGNPSSSTAI